VHQAKFLNSLLAHHVSKRRSLAAALSTKERLVEIRPINRDATVDAVCSQYRVRGMAGSSKNAAASYERIPSRQVANPRPEASLPLGFCAL